MQISSIAHAALLFPLLASSASSQTASSAVYDVTFDATWSSMSHPNAYPGGAHFSPLIGGTHSDAIHFWEDGGIATDGMESMAEVGSTTKLRNEVEAAIANGHAGEVILGSGISSPGQTSVTIQVTEQFPLATIVTMVAPSPDWFVGVDGENLFVGGQWVDQLVVDLYAWDAGTDSGTDFNSANQNTNPRDPIALITGGPFFATVPLGTFTFSRVSQCRPVKYCNPADGSQKNVASLDVSGCDLSDAITLDATNGPPAQFNYLLIGNGNAVVSQPPGAEGDLCITGGSCVGRYVKDAGIFSAGGSVSTDISNTSSGGPNYGIPNCGGMIQGGETWNFQYWHRNPSGQLSSFSEALAVTFY